MSVSLEKKPRRPKIDYTKPVKVGDRTGFVATGVESVPVVRGPVREFLGMITPATVAMIIVFGLVMLTGCGPTDGEPSPEPGPVASEPVASAKSTPKPAKPITGGECKKAPKSMRADCLKVYAQHAYGVVNPDGGGMWSAPEGPALVHEILNQGLTRAEMADYFKAELRNYRDAVTAVKVNMDDLPSSDCWYEIGFRDEDGKLGGRKLTEITTVCP